MPQESVKIFIPGELESAELKGIVASTSAIYDANLETTQEEVNQTVLSLESRISSMETETNSEEAYQNTILNAISDALPIQLLKEKPDAYLRNVHYSEDNNDSYITEYITHSDDREDQPLLATLNIQKDAFRLYDSPSRTAVTYDLRAVDQGRVEMYNLIPGKRYFYDLGTEILKSFVTEGQRRFIWADNVANIRDLGGIPVKNGYIAFDKIIRGSEYDGGNINGSHTAIDCLNFLNFSLDLDLRRENELPIESNSEDITTDKENEYLEDINKTNYTTSIATNYTRISFINFDKLNNLTSAQKNIIKQAFEAAANEVINGGKVYIHCAWGYHRLGLLCALIEGILGASWCEIDKDYELSSFSSFGNVTRIDWDYLIGKTVIKEQYNGSWVNFALDCGISQELIDSFKKTMIIDTFNSMKAQVEEDEEILPQYYSVIYNELVTLKNTNNLIPGAKYRMIDFDTWDGAEVDYAVCSGIPDLSEFRSAYHHFDLLLTAISENELDCNVKALHSARDTEGYFANVDLSKWELKYDLNNDKSKYSWAVNDDVKVGFNEIRTPINSVINFSTVDYFMLIYEYDSSKYVKCSYIGNHKSMVLESNYPGFTTGNLVEILISLSNNTIINHNISTGMSIQCSPESYAVFKEPIYKHIEGRGVIYYMKDENHNELSYDFKNILFKNSHNKWANTFSVRVLEEPKILSIYGDPIFQYENLSSTTQSYYRVTGTITDSNMIVINLADDTEFTIYNWSDDTLQIGSLIIIPGGRRKIISGGMLPVSVIKFSDAPQEEIKFDIYETEPRDYKNIPVIPSNVIIKPWIDNIGQHLNKNIFELSDKNQIIKDVFLNWHCHDNTFRNDCVNLTMGKYCCYNEFSNINSGVILDDAINNNINANMHSFKQSYTKFAMIGNSDDIHVDNYIIQ